MKRCNRNSLKDLENRGKCEVYQTFPTTKKDSKTVLVLKNLKNESSKRTIYLPATVANELQSMKQEQQRNQELLGEAYHDHNLVFTWEDGRPVEERIIAKRLKAFIAEIGLRSVVFHSLRHLSTSTKLTLSGGDIKTVQGDTGHATSRMVLDVYSHIFNEPRQELAQKMEENFFQRKPEEEKTTLEDTTAIALQVLLKNPELAKALASMASANP